MSRTIKESGFIKSFGDKVILTADQVEKMVFNDIVLKDKGTFSMSLKAYEEQEGIQAMLFKHKKEGLELVTVTFVDEQQFANEIFYEIIEKGMCLEDTNYIKSLEKTLLQKAHLID